MASSSFNKKIEQFREDIKQFKLIFEFPKFYIGKYFRDLRNEVDVSFAQSKPLVTTPEEKLQLNENYHELIERINSFEKDCLIEKPESQFSDELKLETFETISLIENCLNNLREQEVEKNGCLKPSLKKFDSELFNYFTFPYFKQELKEKKTIKESNLSRMISISDVFNRKAEQKKEDSSDYSEEFQEINDLIYDERIKVEKILFLRKTMFFLSKTDASEENKQLFSELKNEETSGILILIENEFFGSQAIDFFKSSETKKLTNEILKIRELKKQLMNSKITEPFINMTTDFTQITTADLSACHLSRLRPDLFVDFVNLKLIAFYNNQLNKIISNVFSNLSNLEKVDLSFNQLVVIDCKPFEGSINLVRINLSNNQLKNIDSNAFKGLINLTFIDLSDNELINLDTDLFEGLVNLKEIDLKWNNLTRINPILFRGLYKLQIINLTGNQLTLINQNRLRNYSEIVNTNFIYKLPILF